MSVEVKLIFAVRVFGTFSTESAHSGGNRCPLECRQLGLTGLIILALSLAAHGPIRTSCNGGFRVAIGASRHHSARYIVFRSMSTRVSGAQALEPQPIVAP